MRRVGLEELGYTCMIGANTGAMMVVVVCKAALEAKMT